LETFSLTIVQDEQRPDRWAVCLDGAKLGYVIAATVHMGGGLTRPSASVFGYEAADGTRSPVYAYKTKAQAAWALAALKSH